MTQPQLPESSNNHRSKIESPSFVKRGRLWIPETVQRRRSLLQKVWGWTGFGEKKLWDVLQLLIVPTALAIGAFYLQETAKQRDLQIADDRAKQETLNRYFDQISALLFERKLRTAKESDEVQIVARSRTLAALRELDRDRKGQLVRFLIEAQLITGKKPVVTLNQADLKFANLSGADLSGTNFSEVDFTGADLSNTIISPSTNLNNVDFSRANLNGVTLVKRSGKQRLEVLRTHPENLWQFNGAYLCQTTLYGETKSDRDCSRPKPWQQTRIPISTLVDRTKFIEHFDRNRFSHR